jgi:hypothetical protein
MVRTSSGDTDDKRFFTDDELAQTARWMKESGIDCDLTQLTKHEQVALLSLLTEYKDVFAQNSGDIGLCTLPGCEHKIEVQEGTKPIRLPPHRVTPPLRAEVERQTNQMLEQGIIRPSSGEWASPVVMARKHDGSLRYCVNYKKLNAVTITQAYPLPTAEEYYQSLGGSRLYSTLDLSSAYWQIPLAEESKAKTGFINHMGTFEFNTLSMGLKNSGVAFPENFRWVVAKFKMEHLSSVFGRRNMFFK